MGQSRQFAGAAFVLNQLDFCETSLKQWAPISLTTRFAAPFDCEDSMPVKKLTPVLFVEKIEPVLPFWTQHLGFIKTVEVPDGNNLAFVILQQGAAEVMYQSYASAEKDLP